MLRWRRVLLISCSCLLTWTHLALFGCESCDLHIISLSLKRGRDAFMFYERILLCRLPSAPAEALNYVCAQRAPWFSYLWTGLHPWLCWAPFSFFMKGEHTDFIQQFSSEVRKALISKDEVEIRPVDLDGEIFPEVFDRCMVVRQIINLNIRFTPS